MVGEEADLVFLNGRITTLDPKNPEVNALAVAKGKILATGQDQDMLPYLQEKTRRIDLGGKRVIPGLNDSHLHLIRGGLNYNMELRWDGVPSLAQALTLLKIQAERTPSPQWVRVVGGWSEFQFKEKRMPTLAEINAASPHTPVFILHLYDRALLNAAALRVVGITKNTPDPVGGRIERDMQGNPTGMLIAEPNAMLLYATLSRGPKLSFEDQVNSTRHFMRELNRYGVTSCIDAGGGFQNYPQDYQVIEHLHAQGQMSVRIAYNLFTQNPGNELADFQGWSKLIKPYSGDNLYRHNGAGEMLTFSAADFEDFLQPRPDMVPSMEKELLSVVQFLIDQRWPFRLHATYNETIERALDVFEQINVHTPFGGLRWFFDHGETVSRKSLERIQKLGGGIAVQHRMAFQGEYFVDRYGAKAAAHSPPMRQMFDMGVPVGGGTDATRVASYNPFVCLYWMTTGRTVGGMSLYGEENILTREEALRVWTQGSAYKSNEETIKGALLPGMLADLVVLSQDYMRIPDEEIKGLTSVLTLMNGQIVYAKDAFKKYDPPIPPASPDWSPVKHFGGYFSGAHCASSSELACLENTCIHSGHDGNLSRWFGLDDLKKRPDFQNPWSLGCGCFAY